MSLPCHTAVYLIKNILLPRAHILLHHNPSACPQSPATFHQILDQLRIGKVTETPLIQIKSYLMLSCTLSPSKSHSSSPMFQIRPMPGFPFSESENFAMGSMMSTVSAMLRSRPSVILPILREIPSQLLDYHAMPQHKSFHKRCFRVNLLNRCCSFWYRHKRIFRRVLL